MRRDAYDVEAYTPSRPPVVYRRAPTATVDHERVLSRLQRHFRGGSPAGYARGKRRLEGALCRTLHIDREKARTLVGELEASGAIAYVRRGRRRRWRLGSP
jgi:hypothetical protein